VASVTVESENEVLAVSLAGGRRVVDRVYVGLGAHHLATTGGLVVTSSLLTGAITENTTALRRSMNVTVAPQARDVAISVW
jgi:hypothetical protein